LGRGPVRCTTPVVAWASLEKKQWRYAESDPLKRRQFLRLRERYRRQGKTWLCLDESGFEATAQWPYVYAERGKSVLGYRSGHTRPRTSLLAARVDGRLVAPWLFPGTCTTTLFNTWLEHQLCPLLDETMVVILNHAAFHKSQRSRELIEATGARILFLPPYSPDLNPIDTKSDLFAPGISGRGDLAPTVCWAGNRGYSVRIWYEKIFGSMKRKRFEQPDLSLDELQAVLLIIELTIVPAPTGHRSGALL
jgi:putative transposase